MAVNPSPFGPKPQFELSDGTPAVGNKLFFYVAGSVNTKRDTYNSSTGLSANTNPIILNALGQPTNAEIWFTAGLSYKVVYAPSTDTDPPSSPIWTVDNLLGINDVTVGQDQWVAFTGAPTFVGATSFTLVGDQTSTFQIGRRIKTTNSGGTVYSTISASTFAVLTTITVVNDSGVLDAGLSAVSYALISSTNDSIPRYLSAYNSIIAVGRNIAGRTNSAAAATTIDMTADELLLTNSANNGTLLARTVSVSPVITSSGANGLDTGSEAANTWYYGWVIGKTDGTVAGLISASSTAPTMPTGYTFKALVSAVRNNAGSNFVAYRQRGNRAYYEAGQSALSGGSSTVEATVSVASFVPPNAHEFTASFIGSITADGGGNASGAVALRYVTAVDYIPSAVFLNQTSFGAAQTAQTGNASAYEFPNVSQQFFYIWSTVTGSAQALSANVLGFKLPLGGE